MDSGLLKPGKCFRNAFIDGIFIDADGAEALAVQFNGLPGFFLTHVEVAHEAVQERRTDKETKVFHGRRGDTHVFKGIGCAVQDPGGGICQCTVKVKQNTIVFQEDLL